VAGPQGGSGCSKPGHCFNQNGGEQLRTFFLAWINSKLNKIFCRIAPFWCNFMTYLRFSLASDALHVASLKGKTL
ncbi:MAG: hypothetical protein ACO3K8_09820, partial [Pseudohongiellaceae bacterium]